MTPLPLPALHDQRHHPKVSISPSLGPSLCWAQKAKHGHEAFTESLWRNEEAAVSHLAVLEEGGQHLGAKVRALLALVWHCPGPLGGGSWSSGSSFRWPSQGHGEQITAFPRLPGCEYRLLGPVGHSDLSGYPGKTDGLSPLLD